MDMEKIFNHFEKTATESLFDWETEILNPETGKEGGGYWILNWQNIPEYRLPLPKFPVFVEETGETLDREEYLEYLLEAFKELKVNLEGKPTLIFKAGLKITEDFGSEVTKPGARFIEIYGEWAIWKN